MADAFEITFSVDGAPVEFTGRGGLERLCRPPRNTWRRRLVGGLMRWGAARRSVARDPSGWVTAVRRGSSGWMLSAGGVALATVGAEGVGLLTLSPFGSSLALGVLLGLSCCIVPAIASDLVLAEHGVEVGIAIEENPPAAAFYLALYGARWAPPRARAAWWRRVRRMTAPDHPVLASLLADHEADGGIAGLTVNELTPLLTSPHADARLAVIAAMARSAVPSPDAASTAKA